VPPLFRAPKTRHFTSYKFTTDHALLTAAGRHLASPCWSALRLLRPARQGDHNRRNSNLSGAPGLMGQTTKKDDNAEGIMSLRRD